MLRVVYIRCTRHTRSGREPFIGGLELTTRNVIYPQYTFNKMTALCFSHVRMKIFSFQENHRGFLMSHCQISLLLKWDLTEEEIHQMVDELEYFQDFKPAFERRDQAAQEWVYLKGLTSDLARKLF